MAITGISSMATRQLLAELAAAYLQRTGTAVQMTSVGGVPAARRVQAGEAFDIVVLASDAIAALAASGAVLADSCVDLVQSQVAVAVCAGAPLPDLASGDTLRSAVLAADTVGLSVGPSGVYLRQLFQRWGIADTIADRIVQAPPGVPVGALMARGEVALGFQQLSELLGLPGVQIAGLLPADVAFTTTFTGAVSASCTQPDAARAVLAAWAAPDTADLKRSQGMEPAPATLERNTTA